MVEIEGNYYALLQEESTNGYVFVRKRIKIGVTENGFVVVENASEFPEHAQFLIEGAYNLIKE